MFIIPLMIALSQDVPAPTVEERFNCEWRNKAVETVKTHLEKHPKCDLKDTMPVLEKMRLFFPYDGYLRQFRAAAWPDVKADNQLVFINPDSKWDEKTAVLVLIHEATHVTRNGKRWLCGPDRERLINSRIQANPPCRLFGKVQYSFADINEALEEHLY